MTVMTEPASMSSGRCIAKYFPNQNQFICKMFTDNRNITRNQHLRRKHNKVKSLVLLGSSDAALSQWSGKEGKWEENVWFGSRGFCVRESRFHRLRRVTMTLQGTIGMLTDKIAYQGQQHSTRHCGIQIMAIITSCALPYHSIYVARRNETGAIIKDKY